MAEDFVVRRAVPDDLGALKVLIELSVRVLQKDDYSAAQMDGALGHTLGADTQLIEDGTYFVAMANDGTVVGCGGWSFRATHFGADAGPGRNPELLDPATDAARIRAIFVHPAWARRGVGSLLLRHAEEAAQKAGYMAFEMGSTLTGVPVYQRRGYCRMRDILVPLPNGESLPVVFMRKVAGQTPSPR